MGSALLSKILEKNYPVSAYDIDERRCVAAGDAGANRAASPREVAKQADAIHVFVSTDEQVLDVMRGPNGLIAGVNAGAMIFLHSTILPQTTRTVAAEMPNAIVIDAPITAVPRRVREGKGIALVGGSPEEIQRAKPYLESLTLEVRHFGPLGFGNAAKLAKNFANVAERLALLTAVELAEAAGLNAQQFLEMVRASTQESAVQRWRHIFDIEDSRVKARPVTNLFEKDVALAARLAESLSVDSPYVRGAESEAAAIFARWKAESLVHEEKKT